MAYNKQYVGIGRVIENAYRKTGEDFVDWESAIEWAASLIQLIGVPSSYIQKSTNGKNQNPPLIEIAGYRGLLPNDIVVRGECRRVELDANEEIYKMAAMVESTDVFFTTEEKPNIDYPVYFDPYFKTVYIDGNGESQPLTLTQDPNYFGSLDSFHYKIDGNIIFTDFETGYVEMAYKGFMTDEYGLPMIPDDEKFINAVMWEIIANIDYIKWRKNTSPQNKSIMNHSEQQRDWYVGAAISKGRIPAVDEMEAIKNMWLRSIPKTEEHSTNFRTLNRPERRYTQNNRVWQRRRW